MVNIDKQVVDGFGKEWYRFDQSQLSLGTLKTIFDRYFEIFPWKSISNEAVGFDLGCGSGRWARFVAQRVGVLHCIDPSPEALEVARKTLRDYPNCRFHLTDSDSIPIPDGSADFGYSLGVLHHIPDTLSSLRACVSKMKPGAPLLLYLYYAFDNRPAWFRGIWRLSETIRLAVSRMPPGLRYDVSQLIAFLIYFPLARGSGLLERAGFQVNSFPLSFYRDKPFYIMRNDALDRFGTSLEKRFSRKEIYEMMSEAGLTDIRFGEKPPYWCAVGRKRCEAL